MRQNNIITMKGFIEIKEDSYEDTIEHLHRLKKIACKLIKKLSEDSEIYGNRSYEEDEEDYEMARSRRGRSNRGGGMSRGRYEYEY